MPQPDWEDLERRVARLEHLAGISQAPVAAPVAIAPQMPTPSLNPGALLPVLGRGFLGLAGAYLLRAVTESDSIPTGAGVAIGILYSLAWLAWTVRTPSGLRLNAAVYSLTSVLILAPLLWEAAVHFHAISTWGASAVLVVFVILGLTVSWRKNLLFVAAIVTVAGLITAFSLLIATRDVVPFCLFFLLTAAAIETSACLGHWLSERWLAALAADIAVLLASWLVLRDHGLPEGYAAIPAGWLSGMQIGLLVIYLASIIFRTLLRGLRFTVFETGQCAAAFLIGVGGGLQVSGEARAIAVFALVCGAACYAVSFLLLDRAPAHSRNFYTYSTFGVVLVLAGSRILLAGMAASIVWSVLAVVCVWSGIQWRRLTLQVHGGIYLLLGLTGSGAYQEALQFTIASAHWTADPSAGLWIGLAGAVLCYVLAARDGTTTESAAGQTLRLILAGTLAWLIAGVSSAILTGIYHAAAGLSASHAYCATLRSATLAGLALGLAWTGVRWKRSELSRLMYPAMLLGAYRLMMVDFEQGRKPALFLSLLVYGVTLMALPRVGRARAA